MSRCDSRWKTPAASRAELSRLERATPRLCRQQAGTLGRRWRGLRVLGGNPSQTCRCHSAQHTPGPRGSGAPVDRWIYTVKVPGFLQEGVGPEKCVQGLEYGVTTSNPGSSSEFIPSQPGKLLRTCPESWAWVPRHAVGGLRTMAGIAE